MPSPVTSDPVSEAASRWVIRHGRGPLSADEEAAFQSWQAADPAHRRAFEDLHRLWAQLGQVDAGKLRRRLCSNRPRAAAAMVALAVSVALLADPVREALPLLQADHRTGKGEIRRITLTDGSIATLDADSAIQVHMDEGGEAGTQATRERRIELLAGRVHVQVARQTPSRPFIVATRDGSAEALGTRFDVARDADGSTLTVFESRVRAECRQCPAGTPPATLGPGERARIDADGIHAQAAALPQEEGWTEGTLVFQDMPLAEAVAVLARHTRLIILIPSAEARRQRVSGTVSAKDPDTALALLAAAADRRVTGVPGLRIVR